MSGAGSQQAPRARILVVDDNPNNLTLLADVFEQHNYEVAATTSGLLAIQTAATEIPDLILLDIRMPGVDGFEVCSRLKADERTSAIPIIFISVSDNQRDKVKAFQAGGVDYVTKPFQIEEVLARVEIHLRLQRLTKGLETTVGQLERSVKDLESLSYSISHDLRAPLRAIAGFSSLLQGKCRAKLDPEEQRHLDLINQGAGRMAHMMDDILAFFRTTRTKMATGPVDMTALVRDVFAELQAAAPERKVRFALGELPPATGDRAMLRQAWSNLLGNAIKYTGRQAEAEVEVSGAVQDEELVYCIRDNGAGFAMQYVDKLFGVFQRLHTEAEFEGTGIGLAITKRIIERHGGRIWAEGEVGRGATFHFALPTLPSAHPLLL